MNETNTRSLRQRLPFPPHSEQHFRWRGNDVTRVEGLTDAVFAFAVTLLVASLEGPRNYEGLLDVVRAFPAFVICFAILMTFWHAHFMYHRRYGFNDTFTRIMTMAILVMVLFFVYPLKFLFTMVTVGLFKLDLHDAPNLESTSQADMLYVIYGLAFAGAWSLYAILYWRALRKRAELQLTPVEVLVTRSSLSEYLIHISVCLLSIVIALTTDSTSLPGYTYVLLWPLQTFSGIYFGRKVRALAAATRAG
jgi:uncharacterized membrane protein